MDKVFIKLFFFLFVFLFIVTAVPAPAAPERSFFEGLDIRVGINYTARFVSDRQSSPDVTGSHDALEFVQFEPRNFAGFSVGLEYLLPLLKNIEAGVGAEYNFPVELKKFYYNNALIRDGSEYYVVKEFSNVPVYFALRYIFESATGNEPYLVLRLGYSFNSIDYSLKYWYYDGVPFEGSHYTRYPRVEGLDGSPYYGLGFGVKFQNNMFLEGLYSYTNPKYKVEFPMNYTVGATTRIFSTREKYDTEIHTLGLKMGYRFASLKDLLPSDRDDHNGKLWVGGLNVRATMNRSLHINFDLTHMPGTRNRRGQNVFSTQNETFKPSKVVAPAVTAEYMFPLPFMRVLEIGAGVEHDFENTYELLKQVSPDSGTRKELVTDVNSTVPYMVAKYNFRTLSGPQPYVVGRVGYSFNDMGYYKFQGGPDMHHGGAKDIKNDFYYALGFGVKLNKHFFIETLYSYTKTGFFAKYMEDGRFQEEHFDADLKSLRLSIGYTF